MASSSNDPKKPEATTSVLNYIPRFQVVRLPTGVYSPRSDERCITYCSQSSQGRSQGSEPWCRTICLRCVRGHEVAKKERFPLPPEGQPEEAVTLGNVGGLGAQNVKYWQEGYYLWWSKSRWASQEKLDIMGLTLEQQMDLMRRKEWSEKQRVWEEENNVRAYRQPPSPQDTKAEGTGDARDPHSEPEYLPPLPNFTEFTASSKLIPLSPLPAEIYESLRKASGNVFNPTGSVFEVFRESLENGSQREIGAAIWEKAKSGEAFELVGKLVRQTWERWRGEDSDDDDKN